MKDTIILGDGLYVSSDDSKTGINNNVLAVGSSGSGKTKSLIEPKLLETRNSSLIVTVTKRIIVEKYKSLFIQRGYKVFDMNFVDPSNADVSYNMFEYVKSLMDIRHLAEQIILADPAQKENKNLDTYWTDAAISLLTAELIYVFICSDKEIVTINDVLDFHYEMEIHGNDGLINSSVADKFEYLGTLRENEAALYAARCFKTFSTLPIKTAGCVLGEVNRGLDRLFFPEIRQMAKLPSVDIERLAYEKSVLFITTSPVNPVLNLWANLFYGQLFKTLFEFAQLNRKNDFRLPRDVCVLADDFATGSKIVDFAEYISVFRAAGISVQLMLQSESQLTTMYSEAEATTIINNCDTYIYMGGSDLQTAKNIAERINLPLDVVLSMPVGKEYVFRRGHHPVVTNRYNILANKEYQKLTRVYEEKIKHKVVADRENKD